MTPILYACHRFGVQPSSLRHLGDGHFGSAWETSRKTVLKITKDPREIDLVDLGLRHRLAGLPVIWQGPIVCDESTFAYEREALDNLPMFSGSLQCLSDIAKPPAPVSWEKRLSSYDRQIESETLHRDFPLVIEALRSLRPLGRAVWDLKASNLGLRGEDIVIRDGRCIRFDPLANP